MATAVEAALALFRSFPGVTDIAGLRVVAKHRYGDTRPGGWTTEQPSVIVGATGGEAVRLPVHEATLDVSCYGTAPEQALRLWEALAEGCRSLERTVVTVRRADATLPVLIYFCVPASEPAAAFDEEVQMDVALAGVRIMVSGKDGAL